MLEFKDFAPEIVKEGGVFSAAKLGEFSETADKASHWSSQPGINIINVETVVLPNIGDRVEDGSVDTGTSTHSDMSQTWFQFVRVWYTTE